MNTIIIVFIFASGILLGAMLAYVLTYNFIETTYTQMKNFYLKERYKNLQLQKWQNLETAYVDNEYLLVLNNGKSYRGSRDDWLEYPNGYECDRQLEEKLNQFLHTIKWTEKDQENDMKVIEEVLT